MSAVADKTDPKLWEKVKGGVTRSSKGGEPGQWSARKAQLATQEYKAKGGRYRGQKAADNHLEQWQKEEWGTASGRKSGDTGERYLPEAARAQLSEGDYKRTTAKKRADTAKGKQFSPQPADIARRTAATRKSGQATRKAGPAPSKTKRTEASLMARAREMKLVGRSRMSKAELERAVA